MIRLNQKIVAVLFAGLVASGCATSRGEIDVEVPYTPNPEASEAVKLVEVSDKRVFEIKPKKPYIPSLQNDEIDDPSITTRAIARKRNTYGMGLGDILLPEGRTVAQVVEEALVKALRESGYRVVSQGQAGYETALPLSADINQFWAWFNPGFWQITVSHKSEILLKGDWPVTDDNRTVEGNAKLHAMAAASQQWREVINNGIDDLIENLKKALRKGSAYVAQSAALQPFRNDWLE